MHAPRWLVAISLATITIFASGARAQNAPHLAYVYPAGGQQGATFDANIGGQFLNNTVGAYVSGSGVQVSIGEYERPMNNMQAMQLRERMQELLKRGREPEVAKEIADIRVKLFMFQRRRAISPVLAENLSLHITVAPNAEPGKHELRLATPQGGLSNPLTFYVGQLPEFTEKDGIQVTPPPAATPLAPPAIATPRTDMAITLPCTVNGRIMPRIGRPTVPARGQQFTPGDSDRYHFQARAGQDIVVAAKARDLIPYLADAVPGWFQATLTMFDETGKEVAYDDDYRFDPDPVLHYTIPRDGEYTIEIKDSIYRGRQDFVYRITVGELPFITSIFPLGSGAGRNTTVELKGWNLPVSKLKVDGKGKQPGSYPVFVRKAGFDSNIVPFATDSLPEVMDKGSNNSEKKAQKVKLPVIVNGRVTQPGDWHVYSFPGKSGQEIVAEVYARRLDSPLDSVLKLTDSRGKELAFNDDHEDKAAGLITHQADSYISTRLPANGTYYLYIGDAEQKAGDDYAYRLRISPPRPDFELRVTPSAINAGGGMTVPVTVYAIRRDGFSGDITLDVKDAPRGLLMTGGTIPAGADKVRLTLTLPPMQLREPVELKMVGRANVGGRNVSHEAVPAEDMMQAFAYWHLVPAESLRLGAVRRVLFRPGVRIAGQQSVKMAPGGSARVRVFVPLPPNSPLANLHFELSEPPEGIDMREVQAGPQGSELVLQCDPKKVKPGMRGNLIVNISAERQVPPGQGRPQAARQRIALGTAPAIPFEIVKQ